MWTGQRLRCKPSARTSVSAKAMHTRSTTVAVTHQIRSDDCECCCDDKVVVAASRLQSELASRARFEDELSKLFAQEIAAGRMLVAKPLDQPRLADDQAVSLHRAGERSIAADQADADLRRRFRQRHPRGPL